MVLQRIFLLTLQEYCDIMVHAQHVRPMTQDARTPPLSSEQLLSQISRLTKTQLYDLEGKLLSPLQRVRLNRVKHAHVVEMATHMSTEHAQRVLDYRVAKTREIDAAVTELSRAYEEGSRLRAEYVREYVHGAMELCITDFFHLDEDGDWVVDPQEFADIPCEKKRYIESVEVKIVRGERRYKLNFVSKTAAMALAAKLTGLLESKDKTPALQHNTIPWEQLAKDEHDPIEAKILSARTL